VEEHVVPWGSAYFAARENEKAAVSVGADGWSADYPAASNYFDPILRCGAGFPGWFCDPHLDAMADRAKAAQFTDPGLAQQLWQGVYREVAKQAPIIPFAIDTQDYFVSATANENYQASWLGSPLYDQMWVK
jgi:ABC-type oligopeptide transport system substrate-binding subunit